MSGVVEARHTVAWRVWATCQSTLVYLGNWGRCIAGGIRDSHIIGLVCAQDARPPARGLGLGAVRRCQLLGEMQLQHAIDELPMAVVSNHRCRQRTLHQHFLARDELNVDKRRREVDAL